MFSRKIGSWHEAISGPVCKIKTTNKKTDRYVPKPNMRLLRCIEARVNCESDNDVWVERSYKNIHGTIVYYYRSLRTKRCVLLEPPSGAAEIVTLVELHRYPELREFALGPLDRSLHDIEKPRLTYRNKTMTQKLASMLTSKSN